MPNATSRNVYLVRQDPDGICGKHLVRAVVIAGGPGRAVKALLRHVRTHHPSAVARRSRLSVVRIGDNAPERVDIPEASHIGDAAVIVAVVLGEEVRV
jgi:hypothetical protein